LAETSWLHHSFLLLRLLSHLISSHICLLILQVWHRGVLVGGLDIAEEMVANGQTLELP
jgi:hypothetical protein